MITTDTTWTLLGWRIEEGSPNPENGWRSVKFECLAKGCSHWIYTGLPEGVEAKQTPAIPDQQDQHRPYRAFDTSVDWEVSASCSVCEDEVGDVVQEDDGVMCRECGAYWSVDGTGEYRDEEKQA